MKCCSEFESVGCKLVADNFDLVCFACGFPVWPTFNELLKSILNAETSEEYIKR